MTACRNLAHAHPLVRELRSLARRHRKAVRTIAAEAGLGTDTIGSWTRYCNPSVTSLEAALNVLGYELAIQRRPHVTNRA